MNCTRERTLTGKTLGTVEAAPVRGEEQELGKLMDRLELVTWGM